MLVFVTLGTWLAVLDLDIATIGFFAWIVLTYSLKFYGRHWLITSQYHFLRVTEIERAGSFACRS